jgi:hypothetical protein
MKRFIFYSTLILILAACSSKTSDKYDWSNGRQAQESFDEQGHIEKVDAMRQQNQDVGTSSNNQAWPLF